MAESSGRDPGLELPLAGLGQGWHCEWVKQPTPGDSLRLARHCSQRMKSAAPSPLGSGSFHSSWDASAWGQVPAKRAHGGRGSCIGVCVPGSRATASRSQPLHTRGPTPPGPPRAAPLLPRAGGRAPGRELGHAGGALGTSPPEASGGGLPNLPAARGARTCPPLCSSSGPSSPRDPSPPARPPAPQGSLA